MVKLAEGSFNKIFVLTMDNGRQAIARIPHPNFGVARFTTASEVATMHFLNFKLGLPVPVVLAYSCDPGPENPVESEYIIMEKVEGVNLSTKWHDLGEHSKESIIHSLADLQSKLLKIRFSQYGNLYFVKDLELFGVTGVPLFTEKSADDNMYCIGPTTDASFWEGGRATMKLNRGPCTLTLLTVVDIRDIYTRVLESDM